MGPGEIAAQKEHDYRMAEDTKAREIKAERDRYKAVLEWIRDFGPEEVYKQVFDALNPNATQEKK